MVIEMILQISISCCKIKLCRTEAQAKNHEEFQI